MSSNEDLNKISFPKNRLFAQLNWNCIAVDLIHQSRLIVIKKLFNEIMRRPKYRQCRLKKTTDAVNCFDVTVRKIFCCENTEIWKPIFSLFDCFHLSFWKIWWNLFNFIETAPMLMKWHHHGVSFTFYGLFSPGLIVSAGEYQAIGSTL